LDLGGDNIERVGPNRDATELQAGYFPLKPPRVTVNVENSAAEKVTENDRKRLTFRVVVEPGFKDVFDVFGVGGDDVAEDVNVYSPGW
jgi:hypothetical protein